VSPKLLHRLGPGEILCHRVRQPHHSVARAVREVQVRLRELQSVAIGPESVEVRVGVHGTPDVGVVARAVVRHLARSLPCRPFIPALPEHHLSPRAPRLGPRIGRADDPPRVRLDPQRAHVVVVIGGAHDAVGPLGTRPASDGPLARLALRPRPEAGGCDVRDDRMPLGVERNVVDVDQPPFGRVVAHQRRVRHLGQRRGHGLATDGAPRLPGVIGLQEVQVRPLVDHTTGVPVEGRDKPVAAGRRHLVVPPEARELLLRFPRAAVRARLPVELTALGVAGEAEEEATLVHPPWLRVGELELGQALEAVDGVGRQAPVDEPRPLLRPPADEDPQVALAVNGQARVVVRVVHAALVMDNDGPRHDAASVVVVGDHRQQMALRGRRGAPEHEERLPRLGRVDGDRHMVGRIGSQAAAVLVAILPLELAEGEPDPAETFGPAYCRRIGLSRRETEQLRGQRHRSEQ